MRIFITFLLCIPVLTATAQTANVMRKLNGRYECVMPFEDGRAAVMKSKKWGYVDTLGREIVPLTYISAQNFHNGFAVVGFNGIGKECLHGLIDRDGRGVTPLKWTRLSSVCDSGVAVGWNAADGGKRSYSLVDTLGRETALSYDFVRDFSYGYAVVGKGEYKEEIGPTGKPEQVFIGRCGYITPDGKLIIPIQFDDARDFGNDGLAPVGMQGKYYIKWGFSDCKGKIVVPCNYYSVTPFQGGLALVGKIVTGGKLAYGYIDGMGREIIPCRYDEATSFRFPNTWVATVREDGVSVYQLINKAGNPVLAYPVYDLQDGGKYGQAVVAILDESGLLRYGIVDNRGRIILHYEFDQITIFSDWDAVNRSWNERCIAVKNGENLSFDISVRKKQ